MGDQTFLSIDEVAVSYGRIDMEFAHRNIQRLQQHIFNCTGMASNTRYNFQMDRQRSVTEEELFGDGNNVRYGDDMNEANNEDDAIVVNGQPETNGDMVDNAIAALVSEGGAELPNFSLLDNSSGSYTDNQPVSNTNNNNSIENDKNVNEEDAEIRKKMLSLSPDTESSDFKMRYMNNRSISDMQEKRKAFRNSAGGEVFEEMTAEQSNEQYTKRNLRKSNSLPGNSSGSSSSLSPNNSNINMSLNEQNVTGSNFENLTEKFHKRLSLEGPSIKPAIKKEERRKSLLNRRVSFQDDKNNGLSLETNNNNADPSRKSITTPTEERRSAFRKSSGYGTGSDAGSQETKGSRVSQGSSDVWTSHDSGKGTEMKSTEVYESNASSYEIKEGDERTKETDESYDSSSSQITVRRKTENGAETSANISDTPVKQRNETKSSTGASKSNICDDMDAMTLYNQNAEFMRLKSRDDRSTEMSPRKDQPHRLSKSCDPSSFGNLPNFSTLDESYQVPSSSVAKVLHEEDVNRRVVITKYCQPNSTSPRSMMVGPMTYEQSCGKNANQQPSTVVSWFEEMLGKEEFSPSQIQQMLEDHSTSQSPSPTPNTVENYRRHCAQFKEFGAEELVRASRCNDVQCKDFYCIKLQEVLQTLGSDFLSSDQYEQRKQYYHALYNHNSECEEVKCPVRFCAEIIEWQKKHVDEFTIDVIGQKIQTHVNSPCMNIVLENKYQLLKLQSSDKKPEIVDFDTYIPLFPLGKYGNAVVCKDMDDSSLVVVTKYPMMDYKHQLSLYSRIVGLKHPHIVQQLWLLEYEEKIQVCSVFAYGGNLKDYLTSVGQLPWQLAVVYMKQLLSAICFLHSDRYGVIYLYWCSENFVFTDSGHRVLQLGNFRLACPQGHKLDYGSLKACLPYSICPPELIKDNVVDFRSDCWGAGCALYEMLTGSGYLHNHRHENQSVVHNTVIQGTRPDLTGFKPELKDILNSCWRMDHTKRRSAMEILERLQAIPLNVS